MWAINLSRSTLPAMASRAVCSGVSHLPGLPVIHHGAPIVRLIVTLVGIPGATGMLTTRVT